MTRWLIVNADDLGLCPEVDDGILECVTSGLVTSVSLLVNPPHRADLAPLLERRVSVGLHLNLSTGYPCAVASRVPDLVDRDGRLRADVHQRLARTDLAQISEELKAQVKTFQEVVGRGPTHLDVHKHLHGADERVLAIALGLARDLSVPLRAMDPRLRRACRAAGVRTTDHFVGDVRPAPFWTRDRLCQELSRLRPGTTELMCHPGRSVPAIAGLWYLAERDVEREALTSPAARALVGSIHLGNFVSAPVGRWP